MSGMWIGVDGVARKITNGWIGVDGVARKITNGWIGVDGVARLFFESLYTLTWGTDLVSNLGTVHNYSCGVFNGMWKFYLNTTFTSGTDTDRCASYVKITGNIIAGKTINVTGYSNIVRNNKDDCRVVFRNSSGGIISDSLFTNTTATTKRFTIPNNTVQIDIGLWQGTNGGPHSTTFTVTSCILDGNELVK